ncbi:MAG: hypothetical protein HQ559_02525 [Lentisphaerae bacterium]|nr:hypothetical protein [Lentisphaerota bacterium]
MRRTVCIVSALVVFLTGHAHSEEVRLNVVNPDRKQLPTLAVKQRGDSVMVVAMFPNVPRFRCMSWCYEGWHEFLGAKDLGDGKLELRHRMVTRRRSLPHVVLVTTVTPEPGAVEFTARAELDESKGGEMPEELVAPNMCWQLKTARDFNRKGGKYPDFVKRCFIFTDNGLTFLDKTTRGKIPVRAPKDPRNNPPWVQSYLPVWVPLRKAKPKAWAAFSSDRYIYPVIGAVSKDGKYLTALASDRADIMSQAWHDCMHNNPVWSPLKEGGERVWRVKIYVMDNEPEKLLERVAADFPQAMTLKEKRVPAAPEPEKKSTPASNG